MLYIKKNKITVLNCTFFQQRYSIVALVRILSVTWYCTKLAFVRTFGCPVAIWKTLRVMAHSNSPPPCHAPLHVPSPPLSLQL